jgi:hypothetical protein
MAHLPAVTPGGLHITPGTPSAPLSDGRDRPASVAALGTQELEAGPKRPFGIFHHAPSGQSPSQSSTKTSITRIEEDPDPCSRDRALSQRLRLMSVTAATA